jgi:sortase A
MKKPLLVVSAIFLIFGAGTASYAAISIYQTHPTEKYLPAISAEMNSQSTTSLKQPNVGDLIGTISIPRISTTLPIIEGTSAKELKRGVGHYIHSVIPGVENNSVLAGHRDSVFRRLGEVKIGDLITVTDGYGTFTYEVQKIRIVKANDLTVIVPTIDSTLTLSTCYPFSYIGAAPKRYIVQAGLAIGEPIA